MARVEASLRPLFMGSPGVCFDLPEMPQLGSTYLVESSDPSYSGRNGK